MKVDNTALETADTCPLKYKLRHIDGYVPLRRRPALSFGGAVHEGLAEWYRTGDVGATLKKLVDVWPEVMPTEDFRTKEYAAKCLIEHAKAYPKEIFTILQGASGPIVEQTFTIDTGMFLECPCGGQNVYDGKCAECETPLEPIEYGGVIDLGVDFNGMLYVVDHKTTSVLGNGDYFFMQFKPDSQMTGYIWGLSKLTNRRVGGAIINAIGVYKSGEVKLKRGITSRNQFEIDEWLRGVRDKCNEIKRRERSGVWPMRTKSCTMYGQCDFHSVHVLGDDVSRAKRLEQDYVVSKWNYETRDD